MKRDDVRLCTEPISLADAVGVADAHGEAGGVAVFVGVTRGETHADGRVLEALDYEAYAEMATGQMVDLIRRARERWPIERAVLLHRVGRVAVGEASVVIAIATPHRAEAFEACRWLIDTLKQDVPIWKREVWRGGTTTWKEIGVRSQKSD